MRALVHLVAERPRTRKAEMPGDYPRLRPEMIRLAPLYAAARGDGRETRARPKTLEKIAEKAVDLKYETYS